MAQSPTGADLYDATSLQPSNAPEPGAPKNLLTLDEPEAAKELLDLWEAQDGIMAAREARWEINDLRRQGYVNVRAVRSQDSARIVVRVPTGGRPVVELFNKARTLCRTFVGVLLSDPPAPVVEPTSDTDDDRDAAEVSQRALEDLQSGARLNTQKKLRIGVDKACTYGSAFIRYWIDPTAGGRVPRTLMASPHPNATVADPLHDPATGLPHGALESPEIPEPVSRYVHADGQALTDNQAEAAYDWRPDLCSEVLTGRHVRPIPHTAPSFREAHGVLIASYLTLGQAKRMFPAVAKLTPEETKKLTAYQPQGGDKLLPRGARKQRLEGDEALVFCLTAVFTECDEYPDGAYVIGLGDSMVPYRETWVVESERGREPLPLPIAQVSLFANGQDDPYGDGLMDDLGGANELRAAAVGLMMQHADKWGNMPVFVPSHSTLTEAEMYGRKMVRVMPGSEPKGISVPPIDRVLPDLFGMAGAEMDSASQLQQAAQGVEDPSVKSGRHAYQIIAQVHAALTEPRMNVADAYETCCRIELALARAYGLQGSRRWTGEDGAYKFARWQGSDLGGDVKLKQGTMTMLSPAMKSQVIMDQYAAGMLTSDEAKDMLAHNIGTVLGTWDNPFRLAVRREIAAWESGPPQGWMPPQPVPTMVPGQAVPTPQGVVQGPPSVQTVMQSDPQSAAIVAQLFPPAPYKNLPNIAQLRVTEMARVMAGTKYAQQPPEWRAVLDAEFQRAVLAATPPAPPAPVPGAKPSAPPTGEPAPTSPDPRTGQAPLDPPHPQAA